jgi:hypothetical protein
MNVIHCTGRKVFSPTPGVHSIYFSGFQNIWTTETDIGSDRTTNGVIALNEFNKPSCVLKLFFADSLAANYELSLTRFDTNNTWSTPDTVVNYYADSQDLAIDINNQPHVVSTERTDTIKYLVHYLKDNHGWNRSVIEQNSLGYHSNILVTQGSSLFWAYVSLDSISSDYFFSLHLRRLDVADATSKVIPPDGISLYPNPFDRTLVIHLTAIIKDIKEVSIVNVKGQTIKQLVFRNQIDLPGNIRWDGTDKNGRQVPAGQYFVRLCGNSFSTTKPIIFQHPKNQ